MARIVVYSHKSIEIKRRTDLEDDRISAIWIEAGMPNQSKILICQGYREWQYLGQGNCLSSTVAAQAARWSIFLEMWERALLGGQEVVVMMDANLDCLKWPRNDLPSTDNTYKFKSLVEDLFQKILLHGVVQLVKFHKRFWPGQNPAGLDHVYTN